MKVKKYIADSMPEAMKVIRKELGPEAVILQSKEINQKGLFGRFRKKKIEVIAAKDPEPITKQKMDELAIKAKQERAESIIPSKNKSEEMILQEIRNLRKIMELESEKNGSSMPLDYQLAFQHLLEQDVEEQLARKLMEETMNEVEGSEKEINSQYINDSLRNVIKEKLNGLTFQGVGEEEKIVQFVGPTGVGKTTTIAKVAAELMLKENKKVAFITTDTYRIAAVEQLKTYARILNVPVEVAYNVEDYRQAIDKLSAYDVILVDTAGRNFRNPEYIRQLKEMIGDVSGITTYLVLALNAKPKDMNDIYQQFESIPIKELIFTKADETTQYGSVLSIALGNEVGIAYITNGQDVPDDLIEPNAEMISQWIVRDSND